MIDDSGEIGIAKGIIQIRYLAASISGNRRARDIINRSGGLIDTFSYTLNNGKYYFGIYFARVGLFGHDV